MWYDIFTGNKIDGMLIRGTHMELSELTVYALEKYQIREEFKWQDFPGFSVLSHPQTGKWVALCMRQWDSETGTEIQRCDLKCGQRSFSERGRTYLSPPVRMKGRNWIGIVFNETTEPDVVFQLFDEAVASEGKHGYTIVLGSQLFGTGPVYQDTALPKTAPPSARGAKKTEEPGDGGSIFRESALPIMRGAKKTPDKIIPEKIRQMRRMYEYGRESMESRVKNFCRQGMFMQDYEDDHPWDFDFVCYYPTYHDLTTKQLRGYFAWRSAIRKGEYRPIATSAAYIYIYELLCGIGSASPEDSLHKLKAFETGFLDRGCGDARMRFHLQKWMMEYAVVCGLPVETVRQYADKDQVQRDADLAVLRKPADYPDEAVYDALRRVSGKKLEKSPVVAEGPERGIHLFAEAWRNAEAGYERQGSDLFTLCFGQRHVRAWHPLANTVCYLNYAETFRERPGSPGGDREYIFNACRTYRLVNGTWEVLAYEKLYFDKEFLQGFLQETDLHLRRYLKTGRYLRENEKNAWAAPYVKAVIEADRQAAIEAARPKITIDLSGLEQIRRDALKTQNSLLVEDDFVEDLVLPTAMEAEQESMSWTDADWEDEEPESTESAEVFPEESAESPAPDLPLNAFQMGILRTLLAGGEVGEIIRAKHLMPSIVADSINEALYDEIGDMVLSCDDVELSLVEDYIEELMQLLGGI